MTDEELLADVHDGTWLDAQVFPTKFRAGDIVRNGECSSSCLLAEGEDCDCSCDGEFHGALADVEIQRRPSERAAWWEQCGLPAELIGTVPVTNTSAQEGQVWQRAVERDEPCLAVHHMDGPKYSGDLATGAGWRVLHDGITMRMMDHQYKALWRQSGAAEVVTRLVEALFAARRITTGGIPPCEHLSIGGIERRKEAVVIAALIGEAFKGNLEAVKQATSILEAQVDPAALERARFSTRRPVHGGKTDTARISPPPRDGTTRVTP